MNNANWKMPLGILGLQVVHNHWDPVLDIILYMGNSRWTLLHFWNSKGLDRMILLMTKE